MVSPTQLCWRYIPQFTTKTVICPSELVHHWFRQRLPSHYQNNYRGLYCQLDPLEQALVNFESKQIKFHSRICIWKCNWQNVSHIIQVRLSYLVGHCDDHGSLKDACGSIKVFAGFRGETGSEKFPWQLTENLRTDGIQIDKLVQERRNSSALAMELRLSCTNPLKYGSMMS